MALKAGLTFLRELSLYLLPLWPVEKASGSISSYISCKGEPQTLLAASWQHSQVLLLSSRGVPPRPRLRKDVAVEVKVLLQLSGKSSGHRCEPGIWTVGDAHLESVSERNGSHQRRLPLSTLRVQRVLKWRAQDSGKSQVGTSHA